jgi:hypothetical protein
MKCNRCGVNKSPKRNVKGKIKNNPDNKSVSNDSSEENNSSDKKKKKEFAERVGDWVCIKCKNLNFSFRIVCNRCQLPKTDSEKLFDNYMSNLTNYFKLNEMMQQQMYIGGNQNHPGYVNTNSININNNYYNHANNVPGVGNNIPNYMKNSGYGNQGGMNVSNYMVQRGNAGNVERNVSHFEVGNKSIRKEYYQQDDQ